MIRIWQWRGGQRLIGFDVLIIDQQAAILKICCLLTKKSVANVPLFAGNGRHLGEVGWLECEEQKLMLSLPARLVRNGGRNDHQITAENSA